MRQREELRAAAQRLERADNARELRDCADLGPQYPPRLRDSMDEWLCPYSPLSSLCGTVNTALWSCSGPIAS